MPPLIPIDISVAFKTTLFMQSDTGLIIRSDLIKENSVPFLRRML